MTVSWAWKPVDPTVDASVVDPRITRLVGWFRQVRTQLDGWDSTLVARRDQALSIAAGARPELFARLIARPVGVSHIADLHARATRNQSAVRALKADGSAEFVPLRHGRFKQVSNNPRRPDGAVHEYCPPEQVRSQLRTLCAGYHQLPDAPVVRAAYLHHRLTQIHPFADGNGRTARLLASTPLVAAGLPPVSFPVEDRESRYLPALRAADAGDLRPFVDYLTVRVHRSLIDWHAVDPEPPQTWSALDARTESMHALRASWSAPQGASDRWGEALRAAVVPFVERVGATVEPAPLLARAWRGFPVDPQVPGAAIRVTHAHTPDDAGDRIVLGVLGLGRPWSGSWLVGLTGDDVPESAIPWVALDPEDALTAITSLDPALRSVAHTWLLRAGARSSG